MSDQPHIVNMEDEYKTRRGYPARIVSTNRRHPKFPVCALVLVNGQEMIEGYTATGSYYESGEEDPRDLVLYKPATEPATPWTRVNHLTNMVETKDGTVVSLLITDTACSLVDFYYIASLREEQRKALEKLPNIDNKGARNE